MRVVFIGAGSVVFTRNLTRDILTFPELQDSEIVLMDIDADRLSRAEKLVSRMAETAGSLGAGRRHDRSSPGPQRGRLRGRHDPGRWERRVGSRHRYPGTLRREPVRR